MLAGADHPLSLDHLRRLTDCFGIVQHASHALPDYRSGYTTDDNARALTAVVKYHRLHEDGVSVELATRYLAFVLYAQTRDGRFHNIIGYDRKPLDTVGSEDCFGRALWSLAWVLLAPPRDGLVGPAEEMLHRGLEWLPRLEHPRGKAMGITALYQWSLARPGEGGRAGELARGLASDLVGCYEQHRRPGWEWLLPEMTYANAKLPEALFRAYQVTGEEEYLEIARRTMGFLCEKTFVGDMLCVVGNDGWYSAESEGPPRYDQQPIDAAGMVEAAIAGFDATGEVGYLRRAWSGLQWFFGRNPDGVSLYDPETGGCFDGLMETGANRNRGAESAISLLMAGLSVLEARRRVSWHMLSAEKERGESEEGEGARLRLQGG